MYRGLMLAGILLSLTTWAHADPLLTDFGIYPEPALPTMGAAGSTITDPTFGTTIARITDASFGDTSCRSSYSTVPTFNIDNTMLFVSCQPSSRVRIFDFNKTTMQVSNRRIPANRPTSLTAYWSLWSGVNNYKMYATNPTDLYEYNVTTDTFVQVNQTNALVNGTNEFLLFQLSKSENDDIFADTYAATVGGAPIGYIIYKRSTDTVLAKVVEANIDEVELDKSGGWLVIDYTGGLQEKIRNVGTGGLTVVDADKAFSHKALGSGVLVTTANTQNLAKRNLVTPNTLLLLYPNNTFRYDDASSQQDHNSGIRCNEKWVLMSRFSQNASAVGAAFDQEIIWNKTDGSQQVRRIAHHRSISNTAIDIQSNAPYANSSRDGYFVAFSSNWGNTLGNNADGQPRTDLFVVKVPRVNGALP